MAEPIKCATCGEPSPRRCAYCNCSLFRCYDFGHGKKCCPDCDHSGKEPAALVGGVPPEGGIEGVTAQDVDEFLRLIDRGGD